METATETASRRVFEYMVEDFIKRWEPTDPRERYEFQAQLTSIVRQLMIDAQQPALDRLAQIAGMVTFPPQIVSK